MKSNSFKMNENFDIGRKKVPVNLSDLQFRPDESAFTFYDQYRNLVLASLKKKGDTITWQNNRVLAKDEELSPSFEELILDNVLGLIDTRLPGYVRSRYIGLMEVSNSLMEYKNDILKNVPTFLEEMKKVFPAILRSEKDKLAR
jgi:hypothetical protein